MKLYSFLTEGVVKCPYTYQFVYDVMYRVNLSRLFSEVVYRYNRENPSGSFNDEEIRALNKVVLKLYDVYPHTIKNKVKLLSLPVVVKACNAGNGIVDIKKVAKEKAMEDTEYFFSIITGDRSKYDGLKEKNEFRKDMLTYNKMVRQMKKEMMSNKPVIGDQDDERYYGPLQKEFNGFVIGNWGTIKYKFFDYVKNVVLEYSKKYSKKKDLNVVFNTMPINFLYDKGYYRILTFVNVGHYYGKDVKPDVYDYLDNMCLKINDCWKKGIFKIDGHEWY